MAAPRAQMPSSLPEGHAKRNRKKSRAQLGYEETERAMANQFSQSSVDAGALEISSDEEFNAVREIVPLPYISLQRLPIVNSDMRSAQPGN